MNHHGQFIVIDKTTGKEADTYAIAGEDWAKDLMRADMEGFALQEDGELVLMDECGRWVYCDTSRFEVKFVTGFRVDGEPIPTDTDPEVYRALVANLDAEGVGARAQQVQFLIDKVAERTRAAELALEGTREFVDKLYEVRMEPDKLIILIQLAKQGLDRAFKKPT